jgi:pyruvate ferredoxin oxidoreductase gamma subunit
MEEISMIEIRFHGRGGQGAVTAAEILAKAAFKDGKYSQAFPFFGVERRGAPVMAFTRIDTEPINLRYQVYNPDHVIVLDDGLLSVVDVYSGLKENGEVIINTHEKVESEKYDVFDVDATGIALEILGVNIVNTIILGYFAKKTGEVSIESLIEVIKETFPGPIGEKNAVAAQKAYDMA